MTSRSKTAAGGASDVGAGRTRPIRDAACAARSVRRRWPRGQIFSERRGCQDTCTSRRDPNDAEREKQFVRDWLFVNGS